MTESASAVLETPAAPAVVPPGTPPPAAAPAAVQAAADAALGKTVPGLAWLEGSDAETVGYAQNKGFDDPKKLLESYRNLEKKFGVPAERILALPGQDADDATKAAFYDKLGRPKDAKEYGFTLGDNDGGWTDRLKQSFHKHGVSADQAKGIIADYVAGVEADNGKQTVDLTTKRQAENTALKNDWGQAFQQNIEVAKQGRDLLGISNEQVDAIGDVIGTRQWLKILHGLGANSGEARVHTSDDASGGYGKVMTPGQAQARLNELKSDPEWVKRLQNGGQDSKEIKERRRLIEYIEAGKP